MTVFSKANTIRNRSRLWFYSPSVWAQNNLIYLEMFGHFVCNSEYRIERDTFDSYLLLLTLDGSGTVMTDFSGKCVCKKNDIVLLDCNNFHSYFANEYWEFLWFHFNGNASRELTKYIIEKYGNITHAEETALSVHYFKMLTGKPAESSINNEILISASIQKILADIISYQNTAQKDTKNSILINEAITFIDSHYTANISIDDIAARLKVSKSGFCHIFKRETGFSPYDFILNKRLNRAKYLLNFTDKSIGEISYIVGFQSEANFIKLFKQRSNMTPGAFRKNSIF